LILPLALAALPGTAGAQPAAGASPAAQSSGPKKDPKGIKGISPFWEAVKKGDNAFVARDFDGAIAQYRTALTSEPQNPLGHYRLGEALLAKGDMAEAEASWQAGLRFVGKDHTLHAKLLFVLADLQERKKAYAQATQAWDGYEQFAKQQSSAKTYPATAQDRKQRIEQWQQLVTQYDEVRKRIERRLKEADEKARKDGQTTPK
jgi:tetratricopeptide (TPR) repeat protein